MKLGVVLFNLGGPDSLDAVQPFLENLFSDPAIIRLPAVLRLPLAWLISRRRAPLAREIYARIGGRSPILAETEAQARAIESALAARGFDARCAVAMRYWHPFAEAAVAALSAWAPDRVVLVPLYPQFSTTTTASSFDAWSKAAAGSGLPAGSSVCCFPWAEGFARAIATLVRDALARRREGVAYRILFSAHGLPQRIADAGDPYQWQIEQTVAAVLGKLDMAGLDWTVCYQSRVGPLKWLQPATDAEIRRAGAEAKGLIVVPVAFVSEHSETLVELDMDYAKLATEKGVRDYIRVPTVRTHPEFISGLCDLIEHALKSAGAVTCAPSRICPGGMICRHGKAA